MAVSEFSDQPTDRLQRIADAGLDAMHALCDPDDLTIVISIEGADGSATALSVPEEGDPTEAAFEIQLRHTLMTARALGIDLRVLPVGHG